MASSFKDVLLTLEFDALEGGKTVVKLKNIFWSSTHVHRLKQDRDKKYLERAMGSYKNTQTENEKKQ